MDTSKQVHPGDLITADFMNGILAELADLETRLAKLEGASKDTTPPDPGTKGHGSLVVKSTDKSDVVGNNIIFWFQVIAQTDFALPFNIEVELLTQKSIPKEKLSLDIVDQEKSVVEQPITLKPDAKVVLGVRCSKQALKGATGAMVSIDCPTYPDDKNLNKTLKIPLVA